MLAPKPLLLIILDGYGVSVEKTGNPVYEAGAPNFKELERFFPFVSLQASGIAVGLPWGEAGNSEVGHLTMGAGRALYHHLPRIIYSIFDGSFFENEAFLKAGEHVKLNNSRLHFAGLVSSGSVHSYIDHLYALLDFSKKKEIEKVYLHIFTDGKDSPPEEGAKFLRMFEQRMEKEWPRAKAATVMGRFYAMDRDEKWERTKAAYDLMTEGKGKEIVSVSGYLEESYRNGITDEFIEPAVVDKDGAVKDGDALVFFNFREDSMRQITRVFSDESFDYFPRRRIQNLFVVTMTEYQKDLKVSAAFKPLDIQWPLGRVLSEAGLKQLRVAETEKYAHVTYFFNGGREKPYVGEDRILVPSVSTAHFDEVPYMRAREITSKILENFGNYDVIIANFANADMVGHSGNFKAAVSAVEFLDEAVGNLKNAVLANDNALMVITADHGNIELKRNIISGEKLTEHSLNPVPFFLVGNSFRLPRPRSEEEIMKIKGEAGGILTDAAPTIIEALNLKKPQEMSGKSLLGQLSEQPRAAS